MPLNYRLNAPTGSAMTMRFEDGDRNLEAAALNVVMEAFERSIGTPAGGETYMPEILTDRTIGRIEILESLVERLRNELVDILAGDQPDAAYLEKLLDETDAVMGYDA